MAHSVASPGAKVTLAKRNSMLQLPRAAEKTMAHFSTGRGSNVSRIVIYGRPGSDASPAPDVNVHSPTGFSAPSNIR